MNEATPLQSCTEAVLRMICENVSPGDPMDHMKIVFDEALDYDNLPGGVTCEELRKNVANSLIDMNGGLFSPTEDLSEEEIRGLCEVIS